MGPIQNQIRSFVDAIRFLSTRDEPRNLIALTNSLPDAPSTPLTEDDLVEVLIDSVPGQTIQTVLGDLMSAYDRFPGDTGSWVGKSRPHSDERRNLSYRLLGLDKTSSGLISKFRPVPLAADQPTVIGNQEGFKRWYLPSRIDGRDFYWRNYRAHLKSMRDLDDNSIARLDLASSEIVGRLADPTSALPYSTRGIVVGYVQSGKTTNFTAVIAKAIDAGYRLVIVLTGMHEALRRQTQRRLDMELLGKPNILGELSEISAIEHPAGQYLDDPEWINGGFTDLQGKTPLPGIIRLTDYKNDYSNHKTHALNIVAPGDYTDLFDPKNLFGVQARIAIVKKNGHVLTHFLKSVEMNKHTAKQIPTLIIDDESDQASVNTAKIVTRSSELESKQDKEEATIRKKINKSIHKFLKEMPRAQYVGYTATPFANVFVDFKDQGDIFPKDFLIALDEPDGYMGTSTFFDGAGSRSAMQNYDLSSKEAYIRELNASNDDLVTQETELSGAIAAFIVTGAIKLYRLHLNSTYTKFFRHHTMLIHETAYRGGQQKAADRVNKIWQNAEWHKNTNCELLRKAFESFQPTMNDRAIELNEVPKDFQVIEPYINKAIELIESEVYAGKKSPILVVNGDAEVEERLDFDRKSTWKIVVGGAMLSRGFTIEGLTISYFRRAPRAHDTLLQMGRWFGYRYGYRDLVRIYLAKNASITKKQTVDLYEAFREIAISEEAFRKQLSIYSSWDGDHPAITPRDIRPLVLQSLPWLKPTAAAKMQLAKIVRQRADVFSPKAMGSTIDEVSHNWKQSMNLVKAADKEAKLTWKEGSKEKIPVFYGEVSVLELLRTLEKTKWIKNYYEETVKPKAAFYEHCFKEGVLKSFIVIFPQLMKASDKTWLIEIDGLGNRTGVKRKRNKGYYGEFTDERHRDAVTLDILTLNGPSARTVGAVAGQGVILAYVIPDRGPGGDTEPPDRVTPEACTVGLTIYLPTAVIGSSTGSPIEWEGTSRLKS